MQHPRQEPGARGKDFRKSLACDVLNSTRAPESFQHLGHVAARVAVEPRPLSFDCAIRVDGGTFHFDKGGTPARVAWVRDRRGLPDDLVAWVPGRPGRWYLKEGTCPVLGARNLAIAGAWGDPIAIYTTPAAWVDAAGDGVCILDWEVDLAPLFDGVIEVKFAHLPVKTADRLRTRLKSNFWRFLPQIGGRHAA